MKTPDLMREIQITNDLDKNTRLQVAMMRSLRNMKRF